MAKSIVYSYLLLPGSYDQGDQVDGINLYARELFILWYKFHDSTTEGDGEYILICRKYCRRFQGHQSSKSLKKNSQTSHTA